MLRRFACTLHVSCFRDGTADRHNSTGLSRDFQAPYMVHDDGAAPELTRFSELMNAGAEQVRIRRAEELAKLAEMAEGLTLRAESGVETEKVV